MKTVDEFAQAHRRSNLSLWPIEAFKWDTAVFGEQYYDSLIKRFVVPETADTLIAWETYTGGILRCLTPINQQALLSDVIVVSTTATCFANWFVAKGELVPAIGLVGLPGYVGPNHRWGCDFTFNINVAKELVTVRRRSCYGVGIVSKRSKNAHGGQLLNKIWFQDEADAVSFHLDHHNYKYLDCTARYLN